MNPLVELSEKPRSHKRRKRMLISVESDIRESILKNYGWRLENNLSGEWHICDTTYSASLQCHCHNNKIILTCNKCKNSACSCLFTNVNWGLEKLEIHGNGVQKCIICRYKDRSHKGADSPTSAALKVQYFIVGSAL